MQLEDTESSLLSSNDVPTSVASFRSPSGPEATSTNLPSS